MTEPPNPQGARPRTPIRTATFSGFNPAVPAFRPASSSNAAGSTHRSLSPGAKMRQQLREGSEELPPKWGRVPGAIGPPSNKLLAGSVSERNRSPRRPNAGVIGQRPEPTYALVARRTL